MKKKLASVIMPACYSAVQSSCLFVRLFVQSVIATNRGGKKQKKTQTLLESMQKPYRTYDLLTVRRKSENHTTTV